MLHDMTESDSLLLPLNVQLQTVYIKFIKNFAKPIDKGGVIVYNIICQLRAKAKQPDADMAQ